VFRSGGAGEASETDMPVVEKQANAIDVVGEGRGGGSWWSRRPAQSRELSMRVVELADSMQDHFRKQDERAAAMVQSLDRVGGVIEDLAETQKRQGEYLQAIADRTEVVGKHTAGLTEAVGRVPESLLSQAEAIRTVARQLEVSQESDTQLMHSLQQFGRAVDTLGSSGTAQVEILQKLNATQHEQQEAFSSLVQDQTRRFTVIIVVSAILGLAAMIALAVTLAMHFVG